MAYSRQTEHYGLPLPLGTDKSTWLDNNDAFEAVDLALAGAVAKGETHDAAIEDLSTGLTSLGATVAGHTTDIAALESRMTAEETIGANATQAIAQLSEKVYDYEERTFTTAAECFTFLGSLPNRELKDVLVTAITRNAGTKETMVRDSTGAATVTSGTSPANVEHGMFAKLVWKDSTRYHFNAPLLIGYTGTTNRVSFHTRNIIISENAMELHLNAKGVNYTANTETTILEIADLSSITLYIPVSVADD